jgi:hypothetical protein
MRLEASNYAITIFVEHSVRLAPGVHVLLLRPKGKTWMAGTSPAMTESVLERAIGIEPTTFSLGS